MSEGDGNRIEPQSHRYHHKLYYDINFHNIFCANVH